MERLKGIFTLALDNSHIRLSKLIYADLDTISNDIQLVKHELASNSQNLVLLQKSTDGVEKELHATGQKIQDLGSATTAVEAEMKSNTQKVDSLGQSAKRTAPK